MRIFSKKNTSTKVSAIARSNEDIRTVTIDTSQKLPVVLKAATGAWPGVLHARASALLASLSKSDNATLVLAVNEYKFLSMEMPQVSGDDLKQAVRWKMQEMVDFDLASAKTDAIVVPAAAETPSVNQTVFAAACENKVLGPYQESFREAKINLRAIDTPELSQRNINALLEPEHRACALLAFDSNGGLLTVTYGGELHVARRMDINLEQVTTADAETRTHFFEKVTLELQRSFDHLERQFRHLTLGKLVLFPLENEYLQLHLKHELYVPVEILNLSTIFDFSACPELLEIPAQQSYFYALGGSLRFTGE